MFISTYVNSTNIYWVHIICKAMCLELCNSQKYRRYSDLLLLLGILNNLPVFLWLSVSFRHSVSLFLSTHPFQSSSVWLPHLYFYWTESNTVSNLRKKFQINFSDHSFSCKSLIDPTTFRACKFKCLASPGRSFLSKARQREEKKMESRSPVWKMQQYICSR